MKFFGRLAWVFFLAGAAARVVCGQETVDRLDMRAHEAYDAQQYDRAIALWTQVIKLDPKDATAWFNRATAYEDEKETAKAIADYGEAIRLDPKDAYSYQRRAALYEENGDKEKALADVEELAGLRPDNADIRGELARLHTENGDNAKALDDYSAIIKMDPKDAAGYYNRGTFYLDSLFDYDKAISDISEGLKLNPRPDAYGARAVAYLGKGDTAKALDDCNDAIKAFPDSYEVFLARGVVYTITGDNDKAMADFNQAIKINPGYPEAYSRRGLLHAAKGDRDAALADFAQALVIDPKNAEAYEDRGDAYCSNHEWDKALEDLKKGLELAGPSSAQALNALAWFYATCPKAELRDGAKSMELAAKACELSDWKDDAIIDTLAAAEAEAGKWEAALKHEKQAKEMAAAAKKDDKTLKDYDSRIALFGQKKSYQDERKTNPGGTAARQ
jgi:tetratricopeptide (TPR) repeat protein